jgi:hypothetical protein
LPRIKILAHFVPPSLTNEKKGFLTFDTCSEARFSERREVKATLEELFELTTDDDDDGVLTTPSLGLPPRPLGFFRFFLAWMASTRRLTSVLELILCLDQDLNERSLFRETEISTDLLVRRDGEVEKKEMLVWLQLPLRKF